MALRIVPAFSQITEADAAVSHKPDLYAAQQLVTGYHELPVLIQKLEAEIVADDLCVVNALRELDRLGQRHECYGAVDEAMVRIAEAARQDLRYLSDRRHNPSYEEAVTYRANLLLSKSNTAPSKVDSVVQDLVSFASMDNGIGQNKRHALWVLEQLNHYYPEKSSVKEAIQELSGSSPSATASFSL